MVIKRFEDIIAWQKAQDLAVDIYKCVNELSDRSFKGQITSAVVSISNNIAEGFDRNTDADFIRFLVIAKGSCYEVKSMLYLAERLNYIDTPFCTSFRKRSEEISKIINGLINSMKSNKFKKTVEYN